MKQLKMKLLSLFVATAFGVSGLASAATTAGTVTLTGTVAVVCAVTSPTVDLATVSLGTTPTPKAFTVNVTCSNGAPWSIYSTNIPTTVTVGADTTHNTAVLMDSLGTSFLNMIPITGTGTGAIQATSMTVKFVSSTGSGAISTPTPIPFTINY